MPDMDRVIWYRPRVRLWKDRKQEWHLAGEPDGISKVVTAFRQVARGGSDSADVELRTEAIPLDRNPAAEFGVVGIHEVLTIERLASRRSDPLPLRIMSVEQTVRLQFSDATKPVLGFALLELLDGEGDFYINVEDASGAARRLWFWGYSNPHGVNSF
jgi:hypothetical protein